MTTTQQTDREITMRCKAFSGQGVREHRLQVAADGTVRVWDPVAGYYTTCHSMARSAQTRARNLAAA